MDSDPIKFRVRENVAIVTLNRPGQHNALSLDMATELAQAIQSCADSSV